MIGLNPEREGMGWGLMTGSLWVWTALMQCLAVWGWLRMLGRRGVRLQERLLSAVMGGQVKPCKIM